MKFKNKFLLFMLEIIVFLTPIFVLAEEIETETGEIYACNNPNIVKVIYFGKLIFDIVKMVVPIGLIIMGMIDFSKSVTSSDENVQKKSINLFVKRIIYAVLVFVVPWLVGVLMIKLGNLTEDVNFTDCIENANPEKIKELEVEYDKWEKNQESNSNVDFGEFDSATVENIAAFIGNEIGYSKDEYFGGLLFEAAVLMNNYDYQKSKSGVDINTEITQDSLCKVFSVKYGSYLYDPYYCNGGFEKIKSNRGELTEHRKKLLLTATELVLTRKFTIPKNVIYSKGYDNNQNDKGVIYVSEMGEKFSTGGDAFANVDVYGNAVSTDPAYYEKLIDDLYNQYMK